MFGSGGSEHGSSPGLKKSLYIPSGDAGSEKNYFQKTRLGGHKSPLRALKNV